jgi:hypothetical protein
MNAPVASLSPTLRPPLTALKALTPQANPPRVKRWA